MILFFSYLWECVRDLKVVSIVVTQRERKRVMALATLREIPRSPEAKLGKRVSDLWDVQEPQLSPTEKLNACFESIPVSAFPLGPSNQGSDFD